MATTIARNAFDDRQGPANQSPFRSCNPSTRYIAAQEMVLKREEELAGLENLMTRTTDLKKQRLLAQRILATKNNLRSWLDYLENDTPREPKAVIQPRPKKKTTTQRKKEAA